MGSLGWHPLNRQQAKVELCPDEGEIDIPSAQCAGITALADRRHHLPKPGLETDASLRKAMSQQVGHPVDVGLVGTDNLSR